MCPAVKKQLLNLYAAFGFTPTKDIKVPGYTPKPPEGGEGPIPGGDISEKVKETEITVTGEGGEETTVTVEDMAGMLVAALKEIQHIKEKYLTGYVNDEDSDEQPDDETLYFVPGIHER